jgi:hypothetical protein
VFAEKIGPDPRNFNQRVSLGRNDLLIRTFLNRLEISSSLRLSALDAEVYSGDRKMLVEENLPINGNRWDFIIERMSFDGTEFTLWKFCHLQRGGFYCLLFVLVL